MERIQLRAYGKLNIGLDITGTRDDGYHLLRTVMQTVNIYDEITVGRRKKGIMLEVDKPFLPADERNLAFKAAKLVCEKYPHVRGMQIDIKKKIPVGGGMAGGSTDAAAVLAACNRLFDLQMSLKELDELAVRIGADVPFCLRKGIYLAEGIGEKLTRLKDLPEMAVLICAPDFSVSTAAAYQAFDAEEAPYHPETERLLAAIESGSREEILQSMGNSLEPVVAKQYPQIGRMKEALLEAGAAKAMMSGSGSTVFGLFEDKKQADEACERIKKQITGIEILSTGFIKGDKNG